MNYIRRYIRKMLKRLCERDYVEEIMWKRLCGRKEVLNMSLVSVKMAENRSAPISSTIRTRQHRSSIINPLQHDTLGYEFQMSTNQI
jgi:hypothetical protein